MTTGEKIAVLRRENGMNQEELAEKLGISRQAVSKWEAGVAAPSTENYKELGKIFGVQVDELLNPNPEPAPGSTAADGQSEANDAAKRRRPAAIWKGCAAVAAVAVLIWTVAQQIQLSRMNRELQEVRRLAQSGGDIVTVQQPAPEPDLLDWSVQATAFDPQSNCLRLHVEAAPVAFSEGTSAQICIRDASGALIVPAVDAELTSGWFGADLEWVMAPADRPAVYLLLTHDGEHRTVYVDSVGYFETFLNLSFSSRLVEGTVSFNKAQARVKTAILSAQETTGIENPEMQKWAAYPVSGQVTLYADGKALQTQQIPIDSAQESVEDGAQDQASAVGAEISYYTNFALEFPDKAEEIWFEIELTDNFGRQYTERLDSIWPN